METQSQHGTSDSHSIGKVPPHELSNIKHAIAIMSGKGGVGKSSVTALLATALRRQGLQVGVLDADITGPSIPRLFGVHRRPEIAEVGMFPPRSATGIEIMSLNLLLENEDDPVIWRGPLIGGAVKQFWTDVIWGDLDYLLIDLPPGTGDSPLTVMQIFPLDGLVIVTSPQELANMVVRKAINMADKMQVPIIGLVENMSYAICPHCQERWELFGPSRGAAEAENSGIPFLGAIPLDPKLTALCDSGAIEQYDGKVVSEMHAWLQS
ncbi:MAG: Mrp/NBP35 family ATP-binding protein [Firmicutes bacterium]|nr:Mrp/NBP35 family ATP-binding protein [Bacillota bacterium]